MLSLSSHYAAKEEERFSPHDMKPMEAADFQANYEIGEIIGQGDSSVVRRVRSRMSGRMFAGKVINKSQVSQVSHVRDEIYILRNIHHTNIASLHEIVETDNELILLMDIALGGELFDRIVQKGRYEELSARSVTKTLLLVTHHLHGMMIIHRDIKPENILLKSLGSDTDIILTDFGLSKLRNGATNLLRPRSESMKELLNDQSEFCLGAENIVSRRARAYTSCGTDFYIAPEVLIGEGYGSQVDLWSIGVVMYVLLCGFTPFVGDQNDTSIVYTRILTAAFSFPSPQWDNVSPLAKDLIHGLLTVDPETRLTSEQALGHPWFNN